MGNVKFGGISTRDLDLVIQSPPAYNFPEKDVEIQHVPGRNGDIVIDKNCYKNVDRSYSVAAVFKSGTDFISNSEKIIQWLTSKSGYQRLEDSYDPDVYRLAEFKNDGSLVNYYDEATAINITFNCKPQRYLKIGENPIKYDGNEIVIHNPTLMPSLPEIELSNFTVDDTHVLMLTIEDYKDDIQSIVTISVPSEYDSMIIDSENQVVYNKDGNNIINLGEYVNFNGLDFPKLPMNDNTLYLKKYIKNEKYVEKYSTLIDNEKETVFALYKPYETLVEAKQDSASLKSYTQLIENTQEIYDAGAYSNLCLEKAEVVEFESFDNRIQSISTVIDFNTNVFAKPVYQTLPITVYDKGSESSPRLYKAGDIIAVLVDQGSWANYIYHFREYLYKFKYYACLIDFVATGQSEDEFDERLSNNYFEEVNQGSSYDYEATHTQNYGDSDKEDLERVYNIITKPSSSSSLYGWEISPYEASQPISNTAIEKQFVSIARLEKNNEDDEDYTKTNYAYLFIYPTDFTKINDPKNDNHYGAFIRIIDNTDDKLSMDSIKYIECISKDFMDRLLTTEAPSLENLAKDFYENASYDHNIINIFPGLKNIIGKDHDCTIILYKTRWVYDDNDDLIGRPELDLDSGDSTIIEEKVIYTNSNVNQSLSIIKSSKPYDPSKTYNTHNICIYNNYYYSCLEDGVTGAWDLSKWQQIDIGVEGIEVQSVNYITAEEGYYYKENKTGIISSIFGNIFNKTGWSLVESGKILETIEWSKREKSFKYESGLTSTSNYTISRAFISIDSMPEYDDIVLEDVYVEDENGNPQTDAAGNKINKVIEARFQISEVDDTIQNIKKIKPNTTGFYKIQDSSGKPVGLSSWQACTANVEINVESLKMKANKAYRFLFIDHVPTYQDEEDFPEWLDIYPILYDQNGNDLSNSSDVEKLNATYYDLRVTKKAFYRYRFIENNETKKTEWSLIDAGNPVGQLNPDPDEYRYVDNIVTFNKIDKLEDSDRFPITQFVYLSHEPENASDTETYVPITDYATARDLVYSTTRTYNKNDIAIYPAAAPKGSINTHFSIYKCLEDNVTGTWHSSKWEKIGIPFVVPDVYNPDTNYTSGVIRNTCLYNKAIYKCIGATTGPWDPTKWSRLGYFIKDVGFYYMSENSNEEIEYPANIPAAWANVKIVHGTKSDYSDTVIEFYVGADGTYKWDTNLEWKYMTVTDGLIVAGNARVDTRLYYLENLPEYPSDVTYEFTPITNASGNPEYIEIRVNEDGYYKVASDSNYAHFKSGDMISRITIYENPTIIHLIDDTGSSLDNLEVTITPRWWKL